VGAFAEPQADADSRSFRIFRQPLAIPIAPVVNEPATGFVAKRSRGADDPYDRGVAIGIVSSEAVARQKR